MEVVKKQTRDNVKNFVFTGEAGCGKSEITLSFAKALAQSGEREVHFFDLDMTKPLFRSRDFEAALQSAGVHCHFSPQFMDAPTAAGWVRRLLRDDSVYTVLDVGGDSAGAKAVGRYAALLCEKESAVYFVVNSFRPWSMEAEQLLRTYESVLAAGRFSPARVRFVCNPNLGEATSAQDFLEGCEKTRSMVALHGEICFACAMQPVYAQLAGAQRENVLPLEKHISYV